MRPERWRRIEDLFHEALDRPPEDRAAFLAAACPGDNALREEVQSLLAQQDGTLLREGVTAAAAVLVTSPPRRSHEGRALGPYVLGPLLGSGGMGDVYRARDSKLGRDIAVKILPPGLGHHPDRLARFERPDGVSLFGVGRGSSVAVSPDGTLIVYAGLAEGRRQLYLRRLDGFDSVPMAGTENGANPFFSPDGCGLASPTLRRKAVSRRCWSRAAPPPR